MGTDETYWIPPNETLTKYQVLVFFHQTAIPCEIDVGDPEGPRQVASLSVTAVRLDDVGGRCKEASTVCMSQFF